MSCVGGWLAAQAGLPRLELETLAGHLLECSRSQIIAFPERLLSDTDAVTLNNWACRLRDGEPLAYITGVKEFWSLPFRVTPAVLVPRADTELLVESAIERLKAGTRVLELGTGSGAIAICLAKTDLCEVTAVDCSTGALLIAQENAEALSARVHFQQSNWFDQIDGRYHMIVANPPYIAEADSHLAALRFEPRTALVSGPEGLNDLATIIQAAPAYLHENGWLLLEHGYDQAAAVRELLAGAGFGNIETLQDLGACDRVSVGNSQ